MSIDGLLRLTINLILISKYNSVYKDYKRWRDWLLGDEGLATSATLTVTCRIP